MKKAIFFTTVLFTVLLSVQSAYSYTMYIYVNTQASDTGRQLAKTCDCATEGCECVVTCYHNLYCSCTPGITNYGKIEVWSGTTLLSSSVWGALYTAVNTNPCAPNLNYSVAGTIGGSYQYDCSVDSFNTTDVAANWSVPTDNRIYKICFYVGDTTAVNYYMRQTPLGPNIYSGMITPSAAGWACTSDMNLAWGYSNMILGRTSGSVGYSSVDSGTGNSIFNGVDETVYDRWHAVCMGNNPCGPSSRTMTIQIGWNNFTISTKDFYICNSNCPDSCSGLAIAYWDNMKSKWYALSELNYTTKNIQYWIYSSRPCTLNITES